MDTTLLLLVIDDVGDAEGRRAWALGIGEDMELRDVQALDEAATLLEAVGVSPLQPTITSTPMKAWGIFSLISSTLWAKRAAS